MTPSQSRILQDVLDQRALMRHARARVDASGHIDEGGGDTSRRSRNEKLFDLRGWLALEAFYAQSLAAFLGLARVPAHRPQLMRRRLSEDEATLKNLGKELLDPDALGRDRSEILWDGFTCVEENLRIGPGIAVATRPLSRDRTKDLITQCTKLRRFSLLVDELISRELP
jgi:hypothetical protein